MLDSLTYTHSDILEINSTNLPRVNVIVTFINKKDCAKVDSDDDAHSNNNDYSDDNDNDNDDSDDDNYYNTSFRAKNVFDEFIKVYKNELI